MDNLETNAPDTANTAEAEEEKVAAYLGKFKDVKALLDAYTSLEAEFTRRSQRLKELEGKSKAQPTADAANGEPSSELRKESLYEAVINDEGEGSRHRRLPQIGSLGQGRTNFNGRHKRAFAQNKARDRKGGGQARKTIFKEQLGGFLF